MTTLIKTLIKLYAARGISPRFQRGEIPGKAFRHQKQNVTQTAGYDTILKESITAGDMKKSQAS